MSLLDNIPTSTIAMVAVLMLLMPVFPEPHLWEKAKMLTAGTLTKPIDIFDVFWHLLPTIILVAKLIRGDREPSA